MKFDLTFTITAVIAICALIAPILTTLVNNHYQVRLKQLELENNHQENLINHKRDLFEEFIQSAGNTLVVNDFETNKILAHKFYVILPYLPEDSMELFTNFCIYIKDLEPDNSTQEKELAKMLYNQVLPVIKSMIDK